MKRLELVGKPKGEHSQVALTFDAEIKRLSVEKDLEIGKVMTKLAEFTGLDERHLYNYRSGKTDIPALLIPIFCRQFQSNALAMAIVGMCDVADFDAGDSYELTKFCAETIKSMLEGGVSFMTAFDDGKIDGHELVNLKNVRAKIVRDANRLVEVAELAHERKAA